MLFSEEAIGFLFENHTRDSKEWFKEHKADYHRLIEEPFAELITALTPIMNDIDSRIVCDPKKISRLYKDARYNKGGPIFRESVWCSLKCQRDKSEYHPMPEFYFYRLRLWRLQDRQGKHGRNEGDDTCRGAGIQKGTQGAES